MKASEFLTGVADGVLDKNDILEHCKAYKSNCGEIESLLDEMMAYNLSLNSHKIVFVGTKEGTEIKDYGGLTIEDSQKSDRICTAMGIIESWNERVEPQQVQPPTLLPVELQTDEAIKRFERAEKAGLIVRMATGYRKNGITKAQLAYFLKRIYQSDTLSVSQFPDGALSKLFEESRLGKAAAQLIDNKNDGGKPRGYKIIDNLFLD